MHEPLSNLRPVIFVQFARGALRTEVWRGLNGAASLRADCGKIVIAVSEDIDPESTDAVFWSLAYRSHPMEDVHIAPYRRGVQGSQYGPDESESTMLIDATQKYPMAPLALPTREHMERAREIWGELGLPALAAKSPWHGYTLGDWTDAWETFARRASRGEWEQNGIETMARQRRSQSGDARGQSRKPEAEETPRSESVRARIETGASSGMTVEMTLKPAPFTYHDPRSLADATGLLASLENARVLAGGQSLMPMMNFRYAMPDHLIDLNKIGELAYLRFEGERLRIGAMTRQRDIEFSAEVGKRCPILHEALAHVGHRQTRNRGTIGGSLCHLDPSAELVNVTALLGGTLHAASKRGKRDIPIAEFAAGYMTTSLNADELLAGITLPLPSSRDGYAFVEFARRHGDFAIVACSALIGLDRNGAIGHARLALSGLGHCPVRPAHIERALEGEKPAAAAFKAAAAEAAELDATEDAYVTASYRQHLARVLTYRALEQAAARALEKAHA